MRFFLFLIGNLSKIQQFNFISLIVVAIANFWSANTSVYMEFKNFWGANAQRPLPLDSYAFSRSQSFPFQLMRLDIFFFLFSTSVGKEYIIYFII